MSYIGRGIDQIDNISTLDNLSFNGSDATFNLTQNSVAFVPVSADALQIQIDGILQSGNYTVSGSTVTFDFTPSGSSVCNGIKHFGVGVMTSVSDGAVTEAKIGSSAVTEAKIASSAITTAKINNGAVTSGKIASGVIPDAVSLRPNAQPFIINGDMAVAQRSTTQNGIGDGNSGYYCIDRFRFEEGNSPAAVWTMTQESLTSGNAYNAGFTKALKMDCTTSDDASGHGDILNVIAYHSERQDAHRWKKGTSSAEKFTLAFWIKATKTGTHTVELRDSANDRAVSASYTISSSDTWEHKVIVFPLDTTGAIGTGNGKGLSIYWCLHHGGNYGSQSLQTAWAGSSTAKRYTGQVNNADNTSNNWHLTGVQLEVGEFTASTLPAFQHQSYGDNLERCQRYFWKLNTDNAPHTIVGGQAGNNSMYTVWFPTTMRATPSTSFSGAITEYYHGSAGSSNSSRSITSMNIGSNRTNGLRFYFSKAGQSGLISWTDWVDTTGKMTIEAEL